MDEKTLQAMTDLAEKLGTTAEYLWGVLLKQAPIAGAVDLLLTVAWVAAAVLWLSFVKRKTTEPPTRDDGRPLYAEWDDEAEFFGWVSAVCLALIAGMNVSFSLESIVAALFNPEYWALAQILK